MLYPGNLTPVMSGKTLHVYCALISWWCHFYWRLGYTCTCMSSGCLGTAKQSFGMAVTWRWAYLVSMYYISSGLVSYLDFQWVERYCWPRKTICTNLLLWQWKWLEWDSLSNYHTIVLMTTFLKHSYNKMGYAVCDCNITQSICHISVTEIKMIGTHQ